MTKKIIFFSFFRQQGCLSLTKFSVVNPGPHWFGTPGSGNRPKLTKNLRSSLSKRLSYLRRYVLGPKLYFPCKNSTLSDGRVWPDPDPHESSFVWLRGSRIRIRKGVKKSWIRIRNNATADPQHRQTYKINYAYALHHPFKANRMFPTDGERMCVW